MSEKEFNKVFSERLKHYLNLNGMNQAELAKRLGVGTASVSDWCNGKKSPRMSKVDAMCEIFQCKRSDLMEEKNPTTIRRIIPVYGRIAAGQPLEMIEDIIGEVDITYLPAGHEYFALKVNGHSMEPDIKDGDIVVVEKMSDIESGQVAVVSVNGEDATCKRVMKYRDGIRLIPSNPTYDPIYYSNEEVASMPVEILGKVVESRHRYQ